jgi:putative membrane protein
MSMLVTLLHPDGALQPHDLWRTWNGDPLVIGALLSAGLGYVIGVRRLWSTSGGGRGLRAWQVASFGAALALLALALVSPLDALAGALFSAHMVQHLMLMLVVPPLLVLASPAYAWLWALPVTPRKRVARLWTSSRALRRLGDCAQRPLVAWTLQAAVLVLWHLPYFYDAAIRSESLHAIQHGSYLGAALLFWSALLEPARRLRHAHGAAILYVFAAAMQGGALGALLTFGTRPWYTSHLESVAAWSLTPIEDQQIAGAIMWVPGGLVYVIGLAALMLLWLRSAGTRVAATEQRGRAASRRWDGAEAAASRERARQ